MADREIVEKEWFVNDCLTPLVLRSCASVRDVVYSVSRDPDGSVVGETVVLRHKCGFIQRVVVTGRNLLQMTVDVLKAVA